MALLESGCLYSLGSTTHMLSRCLPISRTASVVGFDLSTFIHPISILSLVRVCILRAYPAGVDKGGGVGVGDARVGDGELGCDRDGIMGVVGVYADIVFLSSMFCLSFSLLLLVGFDPFLALPSWPGLSSPSGPALSSIWYSDMGSGGAVVPTRLGSGSFPPNPFVSFREAYLFLVSYLVAVGAACPPLNRSR